MKPFLKWVGGKGRLVDTLRELMPYELDRLQLVEPFLGGGAVFFALEPRRAALSDTNAALINTYEVVRDRVDELVGQLKGLEASHSPELYALTRENFNRSQLIRSAEQAVKQAARFIYLNRTCFNGVWRVNGDGKFNVPMGDYKNPTICDEETLYAASKLLRTPILFTGDFDRALQRKWYGPSDFIYLDPPYEPINETSNFTSYAQGGFSQEDQRRLHDTMRELTQTGAFIMQSNSDTPFIRGLYKDFRIEAISAPRSVGGSRSASEVVILNYDENGRMLK